MRFSVAIPCTCCGVALWSQSNDVEILTITEDHARGAGWVFYGSGVRGGARICGQCIKFHHLAPPPAGEAPSVAPGDASKEEP